LSTFRPRLPGALVMRLDAAARRLGVPRTQLVRVAIERMLSELDRRPNLT